MVELQQEKIVKLETDLEVQQQTVQQLQQQMTQQTSATVELERQLTGQRVRWYGSSSVRVYSPLGLSLRLGRDRFLAGRCGMERPDTSVLDGTATGIGVGIGTNIVGLYKAVGRTIRGFIQKGRRADE